MHTLTVAGKTRNATLPTANLIGIDRHGALHSRHALSARYLHVRNDSGATQAVVLFSIGSKTTGAQLAAFAAKPSYDKLFELDLRRPYVGGCSVGITRRGSTRTLRPGGT